MVDEATLKMSMPCCQRCGGCCEEWGACLRATPADLKRWKKERRYDILYYADEIMPGLVDLWIDKATDEELERCPFLKRVGQGIYECEIYETRPEECRNYYCVLCYPKREFTVGETISLWAREFVVSVLPWCSRCGKRSICQRHNFVSKKWLERQFDKMNRSLIERRIFSL